MDIIDRIKQYLNHKGISDYRFEKTLSLSKGYINKAKNPTADILMKMCGSSISQLVIIFCSLM